MTLQAVNLFKSFGTPPVPVLKNININIQSGEFVSLTGRSGSGKSTLLYLISSLDFATSGQVKLGGQEVHRMSSQELHRFRNEKMGFVFQFHYLLPELTALENVLMPARKTRTEVQRTDYAKELLIRFGLEKKLQSYPRQMSGGEQQRVAVARALVMKPEFLFADEPTGNLDTANGEIVMQILGEINRSQGSTIVMVTHDSDFASRASRQIVLVDGEVQ
jgi:ABC-type lipoprotein export system ATPase subunit